MTMKPWRPLAAELMMHPSHCDLTQRDTVPPLVPHDKGFVIQAPDKSPRSTYWFCELRVCTPLPTFKRTRICARCVYLCKLIEKEVLKECWLQYVEHVLAFKARPNAWYDCDCHFFMEKYNGLCRCWWTFEYNQLVAIRKSQRGTR